MTPGTGGSTPATACPPGVFCDNFENDTVGAAPGDWPRVGGSAGDWTIIQDTTKAFSQTNRSLTPRLCYSSNTGGGAPWSGATSISGQVKLVADGSSSGNPTTGQICVRYSGGSDGDYYCLAIEEGMGAQIKVRINNTLTEGPMWNSSIALNNWYDLRLSVDGQGVLTGFVGGSMLGTFTPPSVIQSGYVAVATQNAVVAFDNIVVSRP
jgi:hypothetical protein